VGIIMNGVTGRMVTRQHLLRSIAAIREQGGIRLPGGETLVLKELVLPRTDGSLSPYVPSGEALPVVPADPPKSRVAYAAAHVVADPLADIDPATQTALDWDATLAYRRHLWSLGLCVAEAMDTAQRRMGLDWKTTRELIRRSVAEARGLDAAIVCGAGTDHVEHSPATTLDDVRAAYEEQCGFVFGSFYASTAGAVDEPNVVIY
jgi:hypothetical protein